MNKQLKKRLGILERSIQLKFSPWIQYRNIQLRIQVIHCSHYLSDIHRTALKIYNNHHEMQAEIVKLADKLDLMMNRWPSVNPAEIHPQIPWLAHHGMNKHKHYQTTLILNL